MHKLSGRLTSFYAKMSKPNFIFILTDDQGYGDVSRHGNPVLRTPNMDRLHDESVKFNDFCVSPSCSPSRCALMTGKHEFKSGVTHTILGRNQMSLESVTLAQVLKDAGYATGIFGKWHLGHEGAYRPENRGFDEALTTVEDTQRSHFDPVMLKNGEEIQTEGYRTDILFEKAIDFIDRNSDGSFFCYIPTYSPHAPLVAPEEYVDPYKGMVSENEATFFGMLACIDANIGRLLAKLDDLGLNENTVVILMNDNGATAGVDLWNANMRGCKGTSWFGGTRAISYWRWKGVFDERSIDGLASHMDVFPTVAELSGSKLSSEVTDDLDGISLLPQLKGDDVLPERPLFVHQGRWPTKEASRHKYAQCGVRWKNYHFVRNDVCDDPGCKGECRIFRKAMSGSEKVAYSERKGQFHYAVTEGHWSLYNVEEDPSQLKEISESCPDLVDQLSSAYDDWWSEMLPRLMEQESNLLD